MPPIENSFALDGTTGKTHRGDVFLCTIQSITLTFRSPACRTMF
jgi:hypothetical protein